MGHAGQVAMQGLARPGPPFFSFCFLLFSFPPAWKIPLGRPDSLTARPNSLSRPFSFKFLFKLFLFLYIKPVNQIAYNLRSLIRNQMKPTTLEPDFQYLSHATGPIFLGFFLHKF
jgi:hypothetical protein